MCKVIVVGNDKSSLKSCLGGPLKAAGFDVLAWVSWADIDQTAPPKETELVVFNKCGIEPKENDCGVRCLGWKLDMRTVYATKKAHNINKLLEWKGARSERRRHVPAPSPVEVAPPPPPPPQGPPCVVCGKPVTKKHGSSSGWGWAKTCGATSCVRAARLVGCRKGNEVQAATAKAKAAPVEVEVPAPVVTETSIELFDFNGAKVRVVIVDNKPVWVAKDVCETMGLSNVSEACATLEEGSEKVNIRIADIGPAHGGKPSLALTEEGVYRLVFKSTKPEAERVKRWLAHDVLPALRRKGYYIMGEKPDASPDEQEAVLEQLLFTVRRTKKLEADTAALRAQLDGLDSLAGNLESEQERIEREAKERADKEREERERSFAILRAKQEEIEDALTRPRGPVQTTIVNTRLIMEEGAGKLRDAMKSLAVSAARARMREDWDDLEWVALFCWCYGVIYAKARDLAQVKGKHALLTFSQAEAFKATLNEDMRQYAIRWTRAPKAIPPSYYETAKTFRRRPSQSTSNVLKLVKTEAS